MGDWKRVYEGEVYPTGYWVHGHRAIGGPCKDCQALPGDPCGKGIPDPTFEDIVQNCDEGIRGHVRRLHLKGFKTTDSGDGKLQGDKAEMEGTLPHPHVAVLLSADQLPELEQLMPGWTIDYEDGLAVVWKESL